MPPKGVTLGAFLPAQLKPPEQNPEPVQTTGQPRPPRCRCEGPYDLCWRYPHATPNAACKPTWDRLLAPFQYKGREWTIVELRSLWPHTVQALNERLMKGRMERTLKEDLQDDLQVLVDLIQHSCKPHPRPPRAGMKTLIVQGRILAEAIAQDALFQLDPSDPSAPRPDRDLVDLINRLRDHHPNSLLAPALHVLRTLGNTAVHLDRDSARLTDAEIGDAAAVCCRFVVLVVDAYMQMCANLHAHEETEDALAQPLRESAVAPIPAPNVLLRPRDTTPRREDPAPPPAPQILQGAMAPAAVAAAAAAAPPSPPPLPPARPPPQLVLSGSDSGKHLLSYGGRTVQSAAEGGSAAAPVAAGVGGVGSGGGVGGGEDDDHPHHHPVMNGCGSNGGPRRDSGGGASAGGASAGGASGGRRSNAGSSDGAGLGRVPYSLATGGQEGLHAGLLPQHGHLLYGGSGGSCGGSAGDSPRAAPHHSPHHHRGWWPPAVSSGALEAPAATSYATAAAAAAASAAAGPPLPFSLLRRTPHSDSHGAYAAGQPDADAVPRPQVLLHSAAPPPHSSTASVSNWLHGNPMPYGATNGMWPASAAAAAAATVTTTTSTSVMPGHPFGRISQGSSNGSNSGGGAGGGGSGGGGDGPAAVVAAAAAVAALGLHARASGSSSRGPQGTGGGAGGGADVSTQPQPTAPYIVTAAAAVGTGPSTFPSAPPTALASSAPLPYQPLSNGSNHLHEHHRSSDHPAGGSPRRCPISLTATELGLGDYGNAAAAAAAAAGVGVRGSSPQHLHYPFLTHHPSSATSPSSVTTAAVGAAPAHPHRSSAAAAGPGPMTASEASKRLLQLCATAATPPVAKIQQLLQAGATLGVTDKSGMTALHMACYWCHAEAAALLLDRLPSSASCPAGGGPTAAADREGRTPLWVACQRGHVELVELLLGPAGAAAGGGQVDVANAAGVTPLRVAGAQGHTAVVAALLQAGANVELADKDGFTPLYVACARSHLEVVRLLLAAGASVDRPDKAQRTPLWAALHPGGAAKADSCPERRTAVVRALLAGGADVHLLADGRDRDHCWQLLAQSIAAGE